MKLETKRNPLMRVMKAIKREFYANGTKNPDIKPTYTFHVFKKNLTDFNNMNNKQKQSFVNFIADCQRDLKIISSIVKKTIKK